jgi:hypothetical protein
VTFAGFEIAADDALAPDRLDRGAQIGDLEEQHRLVV